MWSTTSASSSTSDRPPRSDRPRPAGSSVAQLVALGSLVHPFPSVLDGIVSGAFAAIAGGVIGGGAIAGGDAGVAGSAFAGSAFAAIRLGLAMTFLQFGIGATNDVVDAPRDAGRKPGKPIPAGLVSRSTAIGLALGCFALGVLLAAPSGPPTTLLAIVVIAIGLAYDLRAKGTAWSWLPFAVGIPVLPVFGWLGATGGLPAAFAVLMPAAIAAGMALAIGNALVDVERDRAAGVSSVAIALGQDRARAVAFWLLVGVAIAAVASTLVAGGAAWEALAVGAAGSIAPLAAAGSTEANSPAARERAWEIEAVGLALLAISWTLIALS